MDDIEIRLERLEARDAARDVLLHALFIRSINDASDGHALLDELRKGIDGILASPEWEDGHGEDVQAAVRKDINKVLGRAANALKLKERARVRMASRDATSEIAHSGTISLGDVAAASDHEDDT